MASPGFDIGRNPHQHQHQQSESAPEPVFQEAQKWIEEVTGLRFGERDFRSSLENGILLCELLSSIKPGLVKKINRLSTPIAGLDNLSLFLRGCENLGLKGTQLFDPGDLQDTSVRANLRGSDCSRKLKNVLITIYWLGKAAQNCSEYSGPTLDLKVFEGLLSQMKTESDDTEDPKRNIGDSGYIDGCDAERSDSPSPPRHARDDSFDSLDSLGSRSRQTPSPDVVIRTCSEGRGSDSESDAPPRKLPDVRKDDMLARRTSGSEARSTVPFNQYLPNKSNPGAYVPAPLRKKRAEREEGRSAGSMATSPTGVERPLSKPEAIPEEGSLFKEVKSLVGPKIEAGHVRQKTVTWGGESRAEPGPPWEGQEEREVRRMQKLEKAGIRVLPATVRYHSLKHVAGEEPREESPPPVPSIVLRKDNEFLKLQPEHAWDSEEEEGEEGRRLPDLRKDDLASRRALTSRNAPRVQHFLPSACTGREREEWEGIRRAWQQAAHSESEAPTTPCKEEQEGGGQAVGPQPLPQALPPALPKVEKEDLSRTRVQSRPLSLKDHMQTFVQASITPSDMEKWQRLKMSTEPSETPPPETSQAAPHKEKDEQEGRGQGVGPQALPNVEKDDLSRRRVQSRPLAPRDPLQAFVQASITPSDMEKWQRLKMSTEPSEEPPVCQACLEKGTLPPAAVWAEAAEQDDLATRRARGPRSSAPAGRQRFVHFGPVTEMDQKCWERLSIARPGQEEEEEWAGPGSEAQTLRRLLASATVATPTIGLSSQLTERPASAGPSDGEATYLQASGGGPDPASPYELAYRENEALDQRLADYRDREEEEDEEAGEREGRQPDLEKDDMLARRTGAFQKQGGGPAFSRFLPLPGSHRGAQRVTPNTWAEAMSGTPKIKTEALPDAHKARTEALLDTRKTKPEALPDTPKTKTESLLDTPKTKTESLLDTPKTKTESLLDTPKTKTESLPDLHKSKIEALSDTQRAEAESRPDGGEREPSTDSSKGWGKLDTRRPEGRQEPSVSTSPFRHPEPQKAVPHHTDPQQIEHHHPHPQKIKLNHPDPQKYVVSSAAPVPGVAEVVHVTAAYLDSPDTLDDYEDDDDYYKEESLPDLEKDDMHVRRTGKFQKVPGGNVTSTFNLFLPVPGSVKSKSTPTPASKPVSPSVRPAKPEQPSDTHSSSTALSAKLYHPPATAASRTTVTPATSITMPITGAGVPGESPFAGREQCPLVACRGTDHLTPQPALFTLSPKGTPATPAPTMPPSSTQVGQAAVQPIKPHRRPSWLDDDDDDDLPPMSVSMTDMRCEEEAGLPGELRQELMHEQYSKNQEDESQWQDDLARWKNRRRTAAQDLIKKEEERKKMERLMGVDDGASQRRKSIKTYKEIVEEKERREQELREAYRSARSPEEAAAVLQRYALRYTISDAVLEKLQLPKATDPAWTGPALSPGPSPSTGPALSPGPSPSTGPALSPGPSPSTGPALSPDPSPSPGPALSPGPSPSTGPALSPGPSPSPGLALLPGPSVFTGPTLSPGPSPSTGPALSPGPSPSTGPALSTGPSPSSGLAPSLGPSPYSGHTLSPVPSPSLSSCPAPSSGPTPSLTKESCTVTKMLTPNFCATLETVTVPPQTQPKGPVQACPLEHAPSHAPTRAPNSAFLSPKPYIQPSNSQMSLKSVKTDGMVRVNGETGEPCSRVEDSVQSFGAESPIPVQAPTARRKDTPPSAPEGEATPTYPRSLPTSDGSVDLARSGYGPALIPPKRSIFEPMEGSTPSPWSALLPEGLESDSSSQVDHWSWDPDEERKRQERWQQKQERLLQERYEEEQKKLRREWEMAQREVAEEERKYHEEERRILEETVASLTPRSSRLSSPTRGDASPPGKPQDAVLSSLANSERMQELLVKQATRPEEAVMGQKDHSVQRTERSLLQIPVQTGMNAAPQQNGQRLPVEPTGTATPPRPFSPNSLWSSKQTQSSQQEVEELQKRTASLDRNLNSTSPQTQPSGSKRSGSCDSVAANSSPPACPSSIQAQSPSRSVSGKKLCSSCAHPLGKGAAMIIESLSLYFHMQCFKCGVCKGQIGDTSTGTDVRIRNGLLNCQQCYLRSRATGQPTTL